MFNTELTEIADSGCQELRGRKNEEMMIKGQKLPGLRLMSSGDLIYSKVTIVNTCTLESHHKSRILMFLPK